MEHNMCVSFTVKNLSKIFLILRRTKQDIINLHRWSVNYTFLSCQILLNFEISRQIFKMSSNIKEHENSSSVFQVVPCTLTADRQTTKVIAAFLSLANAPKHQSVNAVQGSNRCLFRHPYRMQNYSLLVEFFASKPVLLEFLTTEG